MKAQRLAFALSLFSLTVFSTALIAVPFASITEARVGGGRSMGSRGFRSMAPRSSAPTAPRSYGTGSNGFQQPQQPMGGMNSAPSMGRSGFMSGLAGGIAGGFLGSMLFRSMGYAGGTGGMAGGAGGIGFLEIALFAMLGYFAFRWYAARKNATPAYSSANSYRSSIDQEPGFSPALRAVPNAGSTEGSIAETLRQEDPSFDLTRFKDERMDDFLKLQVAWGQRDLSSVETLLTPEIRQILQGDIDALKARHQINRIENVAVRGTELEEAWQERGIEYATLRFRANLLDYTIDENSQTVVSGDRTRPVRFEECWTFLRPFGDRTASNEWKLSAIQSVEA